MAVVTRQLARRLIEVGDSSRRGKSRMVVKASDHDLGDKVKYIPCGLLDEDTGALHISFGQSAKTSNFMVDNLENWCRTMTDSEQQNTKLIQLKVDNGPENSGVRPQFLNRVVAFSDQIGQPIQLLYYPPYHSKYNPIERCWGILEQHWNGTLLSGCEHPFSLGSQHDLEGHPSHCDFDREDLCKRNFTHEESNAGD